MEVYIINLKNSLSININNTLIKKYLYPVVDLINLK
tara:strand:- start:52 stop:159 length:108 start_codon:yes stop_codon:yes gene_type:complete